MTTRGRPRGRAAVRHRGGTAPAPRPSRLALLVPLLAGGCGAWGGSGPGCRVVQGPAALPGELDETSGVAPSLRTPGVFWTHGDDGGPAEVLAVDGNGQVLGRVALEGVRVYDAEDIEVARCGAGSCLYLGDVGDNYAERDTVFVFRAPEPAPGDRSAAAERLPVLLPDGARDVEALFVLPEAGLFLVSKGREAPVSVYRYPFPLHPDSAVTLVEVQQLTETARVLPRQVTGASGSPDGGTVVIRTYETLLFFRWDGARLVPMEDGTVNLRTLRESQGEGVGLGAGGVVALTSEGGPAGGPPSITVLRCRLPEVS